MICIISDIYIISGKIISNSFKIQYKRVQFNSVTTAAGTYIKKKILPQKIQFFYR